MGHHRRDRLHHQDTAVWCFGGSGQAVCQGSPDQGLQALKQRPNLCGQGTTRRMQFWYLPGAKWRGGRVQSGCGILPISYLCGLAARQGTLDHRLSRSEPPLEQGTYCYGNPSRFLFGVSERVPSSFFRPPRGLSCCSTAQSNGEVLHVPLWDALLYLLHSALRVESLATVVYKSHVAVCRVYEIYFGVPGFSIPRRLLTHPRKWISARQCTRRSRSEQKGISTHDSVGPCQAPHERRMGYRGYQDRASWSGSRYNANALLHNTSQARRSQLYGSQDVDSSSLGGFLGIQKCPGALLGKSDIKHGTASTCEVLHPEPVRRFIEKVHYAYKPDQITKNKAEFGKLARSKDVVHADRWRRETDVRLGCGMVSAHGCSRCRFWCNARNRYDPRLGWDYGGAANLVSVFAFTVDNSEGASGSEESAGNSGIPRTTVDLTAETESASPAVGTRRQSGSGAHPDEHGFCVQGAHDRAEVAAQPPPANESRDQSQLASQRAEPARGQAFSHLEYARRDGTDFANDLARSLTRTPEGTPSLATERVSSFSLQNHTDAISGILGRRPREALESTTIVDPRDAGENMGGASNRSHTCPPLAQAELVRSLAQGLKRARGGTSSTGGFSAIVQHHTESGMGNGRRGGRGTAVAGIIAGVEAAAPPTRGGAASVRLAAHALAPSTDRTQTSAWNKFTSFCNSEGHHPFPAAPSTILAYIGFLFDENRVHASSLDGYMSAVRTRHTRAGHPDPFHYPVVQNLLLAFRRADDARGTFIDSRAALSADIMLNFHNFGLLAVAGSSPERDAVIAELQYLLTWREGSIRTLEHGDVHVVRTGNSITITARPRSIKGRPVRNATPTTLTCFDTSEGANALDLQLRYFSRLQSQSTLVGSIWGNMAPPNEQEVTRAVDRLLQATGATAPPHSFYASHSLRSGSVTACVLLGVPAAVIQARGFWTTDRTMMNVYFDSRLTYTTAMHFFFGALIPGPRVPLSFRNPSPQ